MSTATIPPHCSGVGRSLSTIQAKAIVTTFIEAVIAPGVDEAARAMARAMVAEMHSGYQSLRRELPMNIRRRVELSGVTEQTRDDIVRILTLWAEARARHGSSGPYLFGTFGAADIFYAPVVTRFVTYGIGVPGFAQAYMEAITEHEWMREWTGAAEEEQWVIEQYELVG